MTKWISLQWSKLLLVLSNIIIILHSRQFLMYGCKHCENIVEELKILSWYLCFQHCKTYNKISLLSCQGRLVIFWVALWCLLNICSKKFCLCFECFMAFTSQKFKMFPEWFVYSIDWTTVKFFHGSAGRLFSHHLVFLSQTITLTFEMFGQCNVFT